MIHVIGGNEYVETSERAEMGDYVISSEQVGQPRIYEVYHVTNGRLVLGKYSRGATSLWDYKTLKPKIQQTEKSPH